MDIRKKRFGYLLLFALSIVLYAGIAYAAPLDILLQPLAKFNIAALYQSYGYVIDCMLYFMILIGAAQVGLKKQFESDKKAGKVIVVGVGLALAISVCVWEARSGFRLGNFWPLAVIIVLMTFGFAFFNFVRTISNLNKGMVLLAFAFMFYFMQGMVPSLAAWFNSNPNEWIRLIWALLNIIALFCLIWGVVELIRGLGGGGESGGGGGGPGGPGSQGLPGPPGQPGAPGQPGQGGRGQQGQGGGQQPGQRQPGGPAVTPTNQGDIIVEILRPPRDAPDQGAVRIVGDNRPMEIQGRISGPHPSYVHIMGIYDAHDGALKVVPYMPQVKDRNVPFGKTLNFSNVSFEGGRGQLPAGEYAIFLFTMLPGSGDAVVPRSMHRDHIREIPEHIMVIRPAVRKIKIVGERGEEGAASKGDMQRRIQQLIDNMPEVAKKVFNDVLAWFGEAEKMAKESEENDKKKHEAINQFLRLYERGDIDDALEKIKELKKITEAELEIGRKLENKLGEFSYKIQEAIRHSSDEERKDVEELLGPILIKLNELWASTERLIKNQKNQIELLNKPVGEMILKKEILPELEKLIEEEKNILMENSQVDADAKKAIEERALKTLERIRKTHEKISKTAAVAAPAAATAAQQAQTQPAKKPKITDVKRVSDVVELKVVQDNYLRGSNELDMHEQDIKTIEIDKLLEERRKVLKEGEKVRLAVRNKNGKSFVFNKFGKSEAGEFKAGTDALEWLELKHGDKIEAWLIDIYYDDGKVTRALGIKVKEIVI